MAVNLDYDLQEIPDQQLQRVDGPAGLYFRAYLDLRVELSDVIRAKITCGTYEWPAPPMPL